MVEHLLLLSAVPVLLAQVVPRLFGEPSLVASRTAAGALLCLALGTTVVYALHVPAVLDAGLSAGG